MIKKLCHSCFWYSHKLSLGCCHRNSLNVVCVIGLKVVIYKKDIFMMSQYIAIWNPRPGHRCWFWRGYHHYRHEGQQASHEYDVDELDQVGRGGSFPFCAVLEKDLGRYFFGTRVVSLEGKSVFSQILDTLWPLEGFHVYVQNRGISFSWSHSFMDAIA